MFLRPFLLILFAGLMVGCSTGYAPVSERSLGAANRSITPLDVDEYRVLPGDTLIAIAFRLGMDYRDLARINRIRDQDLIYVGQVLKTKGSAQTAQRSAPKSNTKAPAKSTTSAKPASRQSRPTLVAPSRASSSLRWNWPHPGKVLARFSAAEGGNKGLDISGTIGDPVKATADGLVVYAGSGLLGYGNLVIISHNSDFLSAYGHNSRILVRESQKVKAGDVVAEIGNTGASVPMLHFEIRRDGKPVDPLKYLPSR